MPGLATDCVLLGCEVFLCDRPVKCILSCDHALSKLAALYGVGLRPAIRAGSGFNHDRSCPQAHRVAGHARPCAGPPQGRSLALVALIGAARSAGQETSVPNPSAKPRRPAYRSPSHRDAALRATRRLPAWGAPVRLAPLAGPDLHGPPQRDAGSGWKGPSPLLREVGEPAGTRTRNPRLKRPLLYH